MDYFISDIHFGHKNVIRFCNRPFKTVHEMNSQIVEKWNKKVTDADKVYVVGDVFLCDINEASSWINKLNGYKILIKGNHDYGERKMLEAGFDEFHRKLEYTMPDGRKALIQHFPLPDCLLDDYDLMIHGHIHIADKVIGKKINVSCDIWNYEPISIDTIQSLEIIRAKKDQFFSASVDKERMLTVSFKIPIADFSGCTDEIYSIINPHWPRKHK